MTRDAARGALRNAAVPWRPGMVAVDGAWWTRLTLWPSSSEAAIPMDANGEPRYAAVPDLGDPATFLLCVACLSRRVGFPTATALWYRGVNLDDLSPAWFVETHSPVGDRYVVMFTHGVSEIECPRLALALALQETADYVDL